MEQSSWRKEIRVFLKSIQNLPARGEEHNDVLQGESDVSQPSDLKTDDVEARSEFWSISIYRHHVGPRGNLYVPNEGSFQIPLKTNDVLLESRIDEHWNVDGGQELSGPWTGFTRLSEKPPNGYTWSWAVNQNSSNIQARIFMSRSFVSYVESSSTTRKTALGY